MSDLLAQIVAHKRKEVAEGRHAQPSSTLEQSARAADPPRGFAAALARARAEGRFGLIAEIKRRSPSRGLIREDFDPPALARAYAQGGAACLSVLTDARWFGGAPADLTAARAAAPLPVLRKDFLIDPWQVSQARAIGADCVLLIMAALAPAQAAELAAAAREWGMDVLAEVHAPAELEAALALDTPLIGINHRNLSTLEVDLRLSHALAPLIPPDRIVVAESGIATRADLDRLSGLGIGAFLVGESLMRQPDVAAATRGLLEG